MPQDRLVIKTLRLTCSVAPEQYEGELEDGRVIYIRERYGNFRVGLGATLEEAVLAAPCVEGRDSEMRRKVQDKFVMPKDFRWFNAWDTVW